MIFEYVGGTSLQNYIRQKPQRKLDETTARRMFHQVAEAICFCHSRDIAHRDIKLENILLDSSKNVKLIDFGFATCMPRDKKA